MPRNSDSDCFTIFGVELLSSTIMCAAAASAAPMSSYTVYSMHQYTPWPADATSMPIATAGLNAPPEIQPPP